jgi:hypothetical protein
MKQITSSFHQLNKISILIIYFILLVGNAYRASAQKAYKFTSEHYKRKGTSALVVGGILIVGGTIGTIAHNSSQSNGYNSSIYGELFNPLGAAEPEEKSEVSINLWPAVIAGGTIVSIIGIDRLIKSKRIAPMVAIQQIPGLEHMGIKYGKLPSLGIKYSF